MNFTVITHTPDGACAPSVTIPLTGQRIVIPDVVRDSTVAMVMEAAARYSPTVPDLERIPRTFPSFDVMRLDQAGQLWVARRSGGTQRQFEVYGRDGTRLATLDIPAAFVPLRPMIIAADRLYGFVLDADDLAYLVAYRIVK